MKTYTLNHRPTYSKECARGLQDIIRKDILGKDAEPRTNSNGIRRIPMVAATILEENWIDANTLEVTYTRGCCFDDGKAKPKKKKIIVLFKV